MIRLRIELGPAAFINVQGSQVGVSNEYFDELVRSKDLMRNDHVHTVLFEAAVALDKMKPMGRC